MIMLIHFILSHDTRMYSVFQVTEVGGLQRSSEQDDFFFFSPEWYCLPFSFRAVRKDGTWDARTSLTHYPINVTLMSDF